MSTTTEQDHSGLGLAEDLSALTDGELSSAGVARVCARWRSDPAARAAWHDYQLIGDVLRSDDLASPPGHDSDFLSRFRERLAQEPVVVAPSPAADPAVARPRAARRPLRASLAIAAGFVAVSGVLVVTQMPRSPLGAASPFVASSGLAAIGQGAPLQPVASATAGPVPAAAGAEAVVALDGKFIRDARLDEYLAAHKKFGGSSAPGGPSGLLRNATAQGR